MQFHIQKLGINNGINILLAQPAINILLALRAS